MFRLYAYLEAKIPEQIPSGFGDMILQTWRFFPKNRSFLAITFELTVRFSSTIAQTIQEYVLSHAKM